MKARRPRSSSKFEEDFERRRPSRGSSMRPSAPESPRASHPDLVGPSSRMSPRAGVRVAPILCAGRCMTGPSALLGTFLVEAPSAMFNALVVGGGDAQREGRLGAAARGGGARGAPIAIPSHVIRKKSRADPTPTPTPTRARMDGRRDPLPLPPPAHDPLPPLTPVSRTHQLHQGLPSIVSRISSRPRPSPWVAGTDRGKGTTSPPVFRRRAGQASDGTRWQVIPAYFSALTCTAVSYLGRAGFVLPALAYRHARRRRRRRVRECWFVGFVRARVSMPKPWGRTGSGKRRGCGWTRTKELAPEDAEGEGEARPRRSTGR